jgi:hypothetical protein
MICKIAQFQNVATPIFNHEITKWEDRTPHQVGLPTFYVARDREVFSYNGISEGSTRCSLADMSLIYRYISAFSHHQVTLQLNDSGHKPETPTQPNS